MSYVPPQKRGAKSSVKPLEKPLVKKDEFPELTPVACVTPVAPVTKMNFASLFKNAIKKKNRIKKLKWGTVLLTKNGVIDSLTQEERDAEEKWKDEVYQENQLRKVGERLQKSQDLRREYDPHYESPEEWSDSESEEEEEEEEEELMTDEDEDEFEPEI
jgi:hypothetical protein